MSMDKKRSVAECLLENFHHKEKAIKIVIHGKIGAWDHSIKGILGPQMPRTPNILIVLQSVLELSLDQDKHISVFKHGSLVPCFL